MARDSSVVVTGDDNGAETTETTAKAFRASRISHGRCEMLGKPILDDCRCTIRFHRTPEDFTGALLLGNTGNRTYS